MIIRKNNKENLIKIYDVINELIDNDDCYYTKEEVEELKTDEKNIFLERKI